MSNEYVFKRFILKISMGIPSSKKDFRKVIADAAHYKDKEGDAKASMLIDIENGRMTEIETLHGKVCQLATQLGVDVPVNQLIYGAISLYNKQLSSKHTMRENANTESLALRS